MSASLVEELSRRAKELSPDEGVQLAEEIIASVHELDGEVDAAWDAEIKRRVAEIESGAAELIPAEEVFARAPSPAKVIPARFHRAALDEVEAECARYTDIQPMLGDAFVNSIEQALKLAREFPEMGSPYRYGHAGCFRSVSRIP
jgi:putative addiction module component (TIGR02574 family)